MSSTGYNIGNENPLYLSWRKLHLSRAKLKAAGNTSALLAGFAMIGLVEVNLDGKKPDEKIPDKILIPFAVCTVVLVSVHMLALMISTCILPNIDAIAAIASPDSLNLVKESPHEKMHWYIELAWAFSTVFGIILFMVEIVLLCWVQFYGKSDYAAIVATGILVPVIVIFVVFAFNFYRKLVSHTYQVRQSGIQDLELMKTRLENGTLESYANQDI